MNMEPNSWDQIQSLFHEALLLSPEARSALLKQACGDDDHLRTEVESLLTSYQPDDDELDALPVGLLDSSDIRTPSVPVDAVPGYEILKELHRGGQGVVYEAIQHSTKRKVAIKFMLEGPFADPASKRRFEREVELIGSLQHPGIVPIIDSGVAQGQYYYAMEYIRGKNLDEFVRSSATSVNELLALFAKVCAAADHAHQNGVIHRDLKPSNVLVDERGEPHILDFGLAKVGGTDIDDHGKSMLVSITGQVMGTLAYMSPEQASGRPHEVDMRSDVYALGVVLYELLSGELPYDLDSSTAENLTTIQKVEPRRLSGRGRRINSEVGTIILKALSKDKTRRYPTAGAFGEDIGRYLRGDPVEAKRDSTLYVLKKAFCRHLVPAVVATAFIVLVLVSSVVSWSLYVAADQSADRYRMERDNAEQAREQSTRYLYLAEMNAAGRGATEPGGIGSVRQITEQWLPKPGGLDLRGWEWYYLYSLSHRERFTFADGTNWVWSVAWSPDSSLVASSCHDGSIHVWDPSTGRVTMRISTKATRCVDWSPDGLRLASCGDGGLLKVWDARTGAEVRDLIGHSPETIVRGVHWSPDGQRLASSAHDGEVKVWDVASSSQTVQLAGHDRTANAVRWSHDGKRLASGCDDGTVVIWDAHTGDAVQKLVLDNHLEVFFCVRWNRDSTKLAACGVGENVKVWDTTTWETLITLNIPSGCVYSLSWSPDSTHLAACEGDRAIRIRSLESGVPVQTLYGHINEVRFVSWSKDGRWLASASLDNTAKVWDVATGDQTRTLYSDTQRVASVDWSPDNTLLACAQFNGILLIRDAATGAVIRELEGHGGDVYDVRWCPDGSVLASGSVDRTVRLWNAATGEQIAMLEGHTNYVRSVDWNPDGTRLASTCDDGTVRIWDVQSGKQIDQYDGHTGTVNSVDWNGDGTRLATASSDRTVRILDATTCELIAQPLTGHEGEVTCVCWSPDGTQLASSSKDQTMRVWDASTGAQVGPPLQHTSVVQSVDWSRHLEPARLAGGCNNGVVTIWDVTTGRATLSLQAERDGHVRWSSDGTRLARAGFEGTVFVWDARAGYRQEKQLQLSRTKTSK